ncbi:hypothetical protein CBR_g30281 [Chara braunii]|uniref:Uncharacterized protein n=1 Tax=Chara braunii TaxID=69332 RepID=A0A388LCI6_CHABU|nr:hypothetical protein CBR_g30281 [Chara braunii]|eukprot:GBG80020.1 hypothetical protein CBR_g30281 [Chara braunii]
MGWSRTKQRLDVLEHTVVEMKIRYDSEVEREKNLREEEEKTKKEKEEEERRALEKKDREDFRKQLTDSMNSRLDGVVDLLRGKGNSNEVEALCKDIEKLEKKQVAEASTSFVLGRNFDNDGVLAQVLAEQERMKVQLEDALTAKRRLVDLEKETKEVIQARDEARVDVEKWQEEALRPGKRGCISLTTPTTKTLSRPFRPSPRKSSAVSIDLRKIFDMHHLEVETIQDMRTREFNARREGKQELERARTRIAQLEKERLNLDKANHTTHTPRSNLHGRMEEAVAVKGKEKVGADVTVSLEQEKRANFIKDARKDLRGLTKDALTAIYQKEGLKYVGIKQSVEDIIVHRVSMVFPSKDDVVEVSEDLAGGDGKGVGGDSVVS